MNIPLMIIGLILLLLMEIILYLGDGALLSSSIANLYEQFKNEKNIKKIIELKNNTNKLTGSIIIITNISHQIVNRLFSILFLYYFGSQNQWLCVMILGIFYAYLEIFLKFTSVEFADSIVFKSSNLFYHIYKIITPFSILIEKAVFFQLKIFGINRKKNLDPVEEIRGAIGYNLDKIDYDYAYVLKSAANLINWSVLEIMTHRKNLVTISVDDNFQNILNIILSTYQEYIPVWKDDVDNVVGYINSSSFFRSILINDYKLHGKNKKNIEDYIHKPIFIYKRMTISKFLQMINNKPNIVNNYETNLNNFSVNSQPLIEKIFFVVEDDGSFLGIVHRDNLSDAIIRNTNSADVSNIKRYKNGYLIPGGTMLNNINLTLNADFDTSYITLNNLFLNYYNSITHKNNYVILNNYKIVLLNKAPASKMVFYLEPLQTNPED